MRQRLLIGVITCLIALALVAGAQADQGSPVPTCGGNAYAGQLFHTGPPTHWSFDVVSHCGANKSFLWEIQSSSDNGLHWIDKGAPHHYYQQTTSCVNSGCIVSLNENTISCNTGLDWRDHVWTNSMDDQSLSSQTLGCP